MERYWKLWRRMLRTMLGYELRHGWDATCALRARWESWADRSL